MFTYIYIYILLKTEAAILPQQLMYTRTIGKQTLPIQNATISTRVH